MKVLITGTAGFIGFHLAKLLLNEGFIVQGYDGMTDYYDVSLKQDRHKILLKNPNFTATEGMLEDNDRFSSLSKEFQPDIIIHLAAQAGVRYSLENPRAYINSNIIGTFNVMDNIVCNLATCDFQHFISRGICLCKFVCPDHVV